MNIKQFEANYVYDCELDIVNIEINEEYVHKKTIELEFGVFLDFDENYIPVNIEIISASKIIGVDKCCLKNPDGCVNIVIGSNVIDVELIFKFDEENESLQLNALNEFQIPNSETNFALV